MNSEEIHIYRDGGELSEAILRSHGIFYYKLAYPTASSEGTDPPPDIYLDGGELGEANALAGIQVSNFFIFISTFSQRFSLKLYSMSIRPLGVSNTATNSFTQNS